jgi:hypothetical protein
MNRAEKTKQYIEDQIKKLLSYKSLLGSKDAFYSSINAFHSEFISGLKKTCLIEDQILERLDGLFSDIDRTKTKSARPNEIYWNAVSPLFDKIIKELNDVIGKFSAIKIPVKIYIYDFMTNNWKWIITSLLAILALLFTLSNKCH